MLNCLGIRAQLTSQWKTSGNRAVSQSYLLITPSDNTVRFKFNWDDGKETTKTVRKNYFKNYMIPSDEPTGNAKYITKRENISKMADGLNRGAPSIT